MGVLKVWDEVTQQYVPIVGSRGPAGPEGPTGAQGVQGNVGPQGPQGSVGPTGPRGPTGPASTLQGPIGPTGPQGSIGLQGPKGDPGAMGPSGAAGLPGQDGAAGQDGATGPTGPTGAAGPRGSVGATGPAGDRLGLWVQPDEPATPTAVPPVPYVLWVDEDDAGPDDVEQRLIPKEWTFTFGAGTVSGPEGWCLLEHGALNPGGIDIGNGNYLMLPAGVFMVGWRIAGDAGIPYAIETFLRQTDSEDNWSIRQDTYVRIANVGGFPGGGTTSIHSSGMVIGPCAIAIGAGAHNNNWNMARIDDGLRVTQLLAL